MKKRIELFYLGFHIDGGISRDFNSIWASRAYSKLKYNKISYSISLLKKNRFIMYFLLWAKLLFSRNKNSILLTAVFYPEGLIALLAFRKQAVCVHGTEVPSKGLRKFIFNRVLNNAFKIIANSRFTKETAEKALKNTTKIDVVYPITTFGLGEKPVHKNKNNGSLKLLTVSRLVPHKNHQLVLETLKKLKDDGYVNIEYVIVGKGSFEQELKKEIQKLDLQKEVSFLGFVSDQELRSIYREADVFIMPSKKIGNSYEGFGLVFVEAKAFGVPSIGSIEGGIEDAIKDGHDGFLINPSSGEELYDKIKILSQDQDLLFDFKNKALMQYKEVYAPEILMKELDLVLNN